MQEAFREAGEKVLGFRRKKKEEWIKEETWKKIDERRQTKEKINNTRSERLKEKHRSFYSELKKTGEEDDKSRQEGLHRETGR